MLFNFASSVPGFATAPGAGLVPVPVLPLLLAAAAPLLLAIASASPLEIGLVPVPLVPVFPVPALLRVAVDFTTNGALPVPGALVSNAVRLTPEPAVFVETDVLGLNRLTPGMNVDTDEGVNVVVPAVDFGALVTLLLLAGVLPVMAVPLSPKDCTRAAVLTVGLLLAAVLVLDDVLVVALLLEALAFAAACASSSSRAFSCAAATAACSEAELTAMPMFSTPAGSLLVARTAGRSHAWASSTC